MSMPWKVNLLLIGWNEPLWIAHISAIYCTFVAGILLMPISIWLRLWSEEGKLSSVMPADIPSRHPISNGRRWLSRSRCLVPSVAVATPCPGRSSGLHKGMSIARFGTRWMPSSNNAGLQISRHFILVAVRLRAYAGTLGSVPWYTAQCTGVRCPTYYCHSAQRTAVLQPNVLASGWGTP